MPRRSVGLIVLSPVLGVVIDVLVSYAMMNYQGFASEMECYNLRLLMPHPRRWGVVMIRHQVLPVFRPVDSGATQFALHDMDALSDFSASFLIYLPGSISCSL